MSVLQSKHLSIVKYKDNCYDSPMIVNITYRWSLPSKNLVLFFPCLLLFDYY